jgi:preprotein translocase subunit YajC
MLLTTFVTLAQAADSSAQPGGLFNSFMLPMVLVMVIFYFMAIRPQNQRQKELAARIAAIKTGDKVVTTGGIHGIVANVREGSILSLKIADGVKIEIDKSAIANIEKEPTEKTA